MLKLPEEIGECANPDGAERDDRIENPELDQPQQPKLFGFKGLIDN